jgi:hypothetical protein
MRLRRQSNAGHPVTSNPREKAMTSERKSKVQSAGAMLALGLVGVLLISGAANAGHKHHNQPKGPQNPGPIGPLPKPPAPQGDIGWHATRQPVAVRDHRPTPVVRDQRAGAPVVRDQRTGKSTVTVSDSKTQKRGGVPCLGNMCGPIKAAKSTIGKAIKTAKNGKYPGKPPIPR